MFICVYIYTYIDNIYITILYLSIYIYIIFTYIYYNYVYIYIYLIIYVYMEAFQLSVEETAKTGNSTWQVYMEDGLLELVQAPEMMGMWKNMGC